VGQLLYDGLEDAAGDAGPHDHDEFALVEHDHDEFVHDHDDYLPLTGGTLTGGLTVKRNSFEQLEFDRTASDSVDHTVKIGPSYNTVDGEKITLFMVQINGKNLLRVRENETTALMGSLTTTGNLNINHTGKQADPSLSFNNGSNGIMGFYSAFDDRLRVTVGGIAQADFHDELFETFYDARVRGDLQVDGSASVGNGKLLTFNGNWEGCRIYNTGSGTREYMVLGNANTGAGINLYGVNDDTGAGNILFYAGEAEGGGSRTVGRWNGPTGAFIAYRDAEVRGNLTVKGTISGTLAFGIAEDIDTQDVLDRAEVATMPVVDDDSVATTDADVDGLTVNEVVTALLAKVKELSARIEELEGA
jgi:hypothetical protein